MKITQLETFVVVAEELHFRRAAQRLYTQPSSVSTQISQLEAEYGTPLFTRNSRNVALTPAGQTLLEKAKATLASIADLERTARSLSATEHVRLTVGLHDEGAAELNQLMVSAWRKTYPNGQIDLEEVGYADLDVALAGGDIDCLIASPVPGQYDEGAIEMVPLFEDGRVLCLPANHPLAGEDTIDADTARSLRYLSLPNGPAPLARFYLNQAGRDTSNDFEISSGSLNTMLHHVALGDGVMTVTYGVQRFFSRPDVAFVPVPDLPPTTISIIHRSGDDRPELTAFAEAASDVVRNHLDLIPTATDATRDEP